MDKWQFPRNIHSHPIADGGVRRGNQNSQNEPGMCPGINTFTFSRLTSPSQIGVGGWRIHGGVCRVCVQSLMVSGGVGEGLYGPPAECVRPELMAAEA